MNPYNRDIVFFVANLITTILGWSLIVYLVMIWISLTVWRRHIPNLRMMVLASRLLIAAICLPVLLAASNLLLMTGPASMGNNSDLAPILSFVIAALELVVLVASLVCFMLAITPRIPNPGPVWAKTDSDEPAKEPWDD